MKSITIALIIILLSPLTLLAADYNVPIKARSVYADDFDLDGDNDIAVGHKTGWGYTNPTLSILENNEFGYFTLVETMTFCGYQKNIFTAKINDDDYPDIVAFRSDHSSGEADRYIRVYFNEAGQFNNFVDYPLNNGQIFSDINFGDFDNDQDIDIVVVSNQFQFWGVLYNDGFGQFSEPYYFDLDFPPGWIACADINNNGNDDILIAGQQILMYSYPFNSPPLVIEDDFYHGYIVTTDLDNDNDIDIIASTYLFIGITVIHFYENLGNSTFQQHEAIYDYYVGTELPGYLNGDDLIDYICGSPAGFYAFYNQGNMSFTDPIFFPMTSYGEQGQSRHVVDLDNNGYDDVITLRYHWLELPANMTILFNDGSGNFVEEPVAIEAPTLAGETDFVLSNYPNPFSQQTTIHFEIPLSGLVELSIYDPGGRYVTTILNTELERGAHELTWNGRDARDRLCSPGVYLLQVKWQGQRLLNHKLIRF
ncbi:MAG: hypothetical protein B6244_13725 [Candidatus Cloacimonetes bacterium 4572_55]|nr:MAG: hypothetical protein B6244_13725 [Candidatus Cloacimonetes bacterium 4572_55]